MQTPWINTETYSAAQLFFYLAGFFLWGLAYVWVVRAIGRDRFVEVPIFAVCGNVTWELLWGFFFEQDMGRLLTWFYRGGFLLDCFITISIFRYGHKQLLSEPLKKLLVPSMLAALVGWTCVWIAYYQMGYDLPLGSNSAYIINVAMSVLYILLLLNLDDVRLLSMPVAWFKGLGTAAVTVFCFLTYPDNSFVLTLGILVAALDALYIVMLARRHRAAGASAVPAGAQ